MLQELKFQLSTAILTVLTVAAAFCAAVNFNQQLKFGLPDDGVTWGDVGPSEVATEVRALRVMPGSGAANAGLRAGDVLLKINGQPIGRAQEVTAILLGVRSWNRAEYVLSRNGVEFKAKVIVGDVVPGRAIYYQYLVGIAYLIIGLFVYYRRGSAQKARHFYIFCLVSFIFSTFHYTGKLNLFDKVIYFGNLIAGALAPTIFLHFCLTFPEPRRWLRANWRQALLYLPALALIGLYFAFTSGVAKVRAPLVELRWMLDRVWLAYLTGMYLISGIVLALERRKAEDPIVRQQMKWLRNGTLSGVLPFALLYVVPYTLGIVPNEYMKLSVLTLGLIPLTLAWAVLRYRLMDVDILFQRGYAYTLATVSVLACFYGIIFFLATFAQKVFKEELGQGGLVVIMLVAAFLFQPVRNWIQERLDRFFYRDRYDYRRTLVEFARELSAETNLERMLTQVAERLRHTLAIQHLAFFLLEETESGERRFRLKKGVGLFDRQGRPIDSDAQLDLSFLDQEVRAGEQADTPRRPYLFFERTRYLVDAVSRSMPLSVRQTIADLDLTYYLPCEVRGRTIGFLGVSRTEDGDFLSTVDVELLQTLSGYVAIAIENARLYESLERKVEENERLKEFNENIVESLNVGILAADHDDVVSSWNTRMEELTGVPRDLAVGLKLRDLLPAELNEQFERVRGESGIHHIYKFAFRPLAISQGLAGVGVLLPAQENGNGNGAGSSAAGVREATLNIAIAPLISRDLEQIGRLIIFDDVTDRTELEQKLIQADKLSSIGLLAAGVAHEVNTPLAVISTYAQMLAKQVADDEQKTKLLEKIARQTFRASEIVNSLLNFSRTSTTEFGRVNVNRVIQETLSLIEHQMQKAGLHVAAELDPELPDIQGNGGKLQQVFLNLFLNARDAMSAGGRLTVRTWGRDRTVHIEVSDTGQGMEPEVVQRIYDPFFTTKAAKKGTGLGLAVTYGIIQEHGGSIRADSRPGEGTRFFLEFPSVAARARKPVHV
jgi:signal transduction histidine kinase